MPVLVGSGDRLIRRDGSPSSLKRPSVSLREFTSPGGVGLVGLNYISFDRLYETQAVVFTVVNKIARLLATLPLKVYARDQDGDKQRQLEGPLAELLRQPWPRASSLDLQEAIALSLLVYGNALVWKSRPAPGATPDMLMPLDWRFITPHGLDEGPTIDFWETTESGSPVYLLPDEVVHIGWRSPGRGIATSPLQALGHTLAMEDAARRYSTASFANAARPAAAYVLPADSRLSKEDRDEIRAGINREHGGPDNSFKTAILHGGGKWEPMSHNAQESELVALRQANHEEIGAAYDLPGPLIGDLRYGTYSNVEELHRMLYETILLPWTVMLEHKLWAQLIAREDAYTGLFVEFDFAERLRGDRQREIDVLTRAAGGPIFTRNEARGAINLKRVDAPEADELLTATNNMTPAGRPAAGTESDVVSRSLARASHTFKSRAHGNHPRPWDRDRFVAELAADAPGVDAHALADELEQHLQHPEAFAACAERLAAAHP